MNIIMKNRKINILLITIALLLGASSCDDFLTEDPKTKLVSNQVFRDLNILERTIDGLYSSYRTSKQGRDGFTLTLLGLDETKQGIVQMMDASQASLDYYNGRLNGTAEPIAKMWSRRWRAVNDAAKSIRGLNMLAEAEINKAEMEGREIDEEKMDKIRLLKANASFVRAICMFEMSMYWGKLPVIEIEDLDETDIDVTMRPLDVVWKQIFDDFTYASENLDTGKQTSNRATTGAAIAMLGKLHMYAPVESGYRDYGKAIEYFEQIKNNYSLEPKYADLFDEYGKMQFNSNESVFEIDFICNETAPSRWQWDMGSRTLANLGESCYIGGYDVALPTEYAYKMKSEGGVWEDGDLRKDVSIRYDFTYRGQPFETPVWGADELDPHIKKWEDRRVDKFTTPANAKDATDGRTFYRSGKNYLMIRYADVLLCYAECLNEVDRTGEAISIVNDVRKRAWGGTLPADKEWSGISKEQFKVDILDERMRELCFEGWRRMDLIRTGKFVELIKERNKWAKELGAIQDYHMLWPIPEVEIKNNKYMTMDDQNPGY